MKKLWNKISGTWRAVIPRPVLIGLNLLMAAALLCGYYVFRGCPALTVEQAYRRAEARNLVGPGEILGILPVDGGGYDRLLLAETEYGVVQFSYLYENIGLIKGNTFSSWDGNLIYREKEGPVTLMAALGIDHYSYRDAMIMPLILFDDCPTAVRAELEFRLTGEHNSVEYDYSYSLRTDRTAGGYFTFELQVEDDTEQYAVARLSGLYEVSGGGGKSVPAQVRLYDGKGGLVYEGTATFQSAPAAAQAKRNDT